MKYLSICSGICAATVAWQPLGWQPVAFSEIEPFPSAVLAHHYPSVPNFGDMTQYLSWPEELLAEVDIVVGGTPCQAFSVAGLRNSLSDERGNLTLIYVQLINHIDSIRAMHGRPPVICVWENVPGVLSTKDNAFGSFLGGLAGSGIPLAPPGGEWEYAGYVRGPLRTIAWRSLDAQYFGVPQRRHRVFLVGSARVGFRPEEILFEHKGVRRDSPPRRKAGKSVARGFEVGPASCGFTDTAPTLDTGCKDGPIRNQLGCGVISKTGPGSFVSETVGALCANGKAAGSATGQDAENGMLIASTVTAKWAKGSGGPSGGPSGDECQNLIPVGISGEIARTLSARHDGSPCADRGPEIVIVPVHSTGDGFWQEGFGTLRAREQDSHGNAGGQIAIAAPLTASYGKQVDSSASSNGPPNLLNLGHAVRRLTPRECERLQGFPDDYTLIPWRGKTADQCPDGPRYKALGNSKAVPVIGWIGERISASVGAMEVAA